MQTSKLWTHCILAVFVSIAVLCLITLVTGLPGWGNKQAEWIGALGTVGAFCGTILIATSEQRHRNRTERDLATVAAASLVDRIKKYYGTAKGVSDHLGESARFQRDELLTLKNWLAGVDLWDQHEVVPLTVLPNQVAPRLQRVISRHHRMIRGFNELEHATRESFLRHRYATIRTDLKRSIDDLNQTDAEFAKLLQGLYQNDEGMH